MTGKRTPLSNLGGAIEARGDPAFRFPLVAAMKAQDEGPERSSLTHSFHSYPARMHPAIARVLLRELSLGYGSEVLDPFCGSGTVALEAFVAGWRSLGSDLDPLALRLARVKCDRRGPAKRARFIERLEQVAAASERRVRGRVEVRASLSAAEREFYEVHVLKELAGLLEELRAVRDSRDRRALEMVFSAIVVKFSRQRGDTSRAQTDKKIRKGLPTEFFVRKGRELAEGWAALDKAVPSRGAHEPRFVQADARTLPATLAGAYHCDLLLSSPPYGGTYDYLHHHAGRHAWLGINPKKLREGELGARRRFSKVERAAGGRALAEWDEQLLAVLRTVKTLLAPAGLAVLLLGDGEIGGQRVAADRQLERLAPKADLEFVAVATQPRPDWRGGEARGEHLIALQHPG